MNLNRSNKQESVISRLNNGDRIAFNELFDSYGIKLFNFSLKYTHNKEDAEEIVQETFLKIWENRKEIREDLSFNAYIIKIARNLIFNKAKRRVREHAMKKYYAGFSQIDNSTENEIIYSDLNKFENKLIDTLPERRKEILMLKKSGYTNNQIAEKLNISKSTVENSINKALKYLQNYFKNNELLVVALLSIIRFL